MMFYASGQINNVFVIIAGSQREEPNKYTSSYSCGDHTSTISSFMQSQVCTTNSRIFLI